LLTRLGVSHEHAEQVLGHSIKGVAGTYNRHDYIAEKAHALTKLAALVETIINPPTGNVSTCNRGKDLTHELHRHP
jgi:hypothetical protein